MHGRGRSTQRWDPGVLDAATGTLGWRRTDVRQGLFLTWSDPFLLDDSGKTFGRAGRAGLLAQNLSPGLRDCSGLTDFGHRDWVLQWCGQ